MALTAKELKTLLNNLVWQYKKDHTKDVFGYTVKSGKHLNEIEILAKWAEKNLKTQDDVNRIMIDLDGWFSDKLTIDYWNKGENINKFIEELNSNSDAHSFYRGIGLIIKLHYGKEYKDGIYDGIKEVSEITNKKENITKTDETPQQDKKLHM